MKFTIAAFAGIIAIVNGLPAFTNTAFDVAVGVPFTLTWTNNTGPVTIQLMTGPDATSLNPTGSPIDSDDSGTSYTWTPPASLASGLYAFKISDSTDTPNYSESFDLQGSASASASSSSASVTSLTTSTSSTSKTSATSKTSVTTSSISSSTSSVSSNSNSSATQASTTTAQTTVSASTSTSASNSATTTIANSNDGQRFSSSLALLLVTVAALVCLN